ncbi:DUF427 domain-containing protein [Dyella sp. C11]|uniref:DUF427 domain-containing protein n=1 Tax=Dyella sp. C11 TaxID=2126991 RepID=UPI000D65CA80|nr:DUF427 domain-containing protein [Dyella sp. C11]
MGLSWQQGPLSGASVGHFITPTPLPERLLFAERLRRRMRVKFADEWIVDSEDVILLHEPARYPVAYFPISAVLPGVLVRENRTTKHRDLGSTDWYAVTVGARRADHAAWQHADLPDYANVLRERVAFAWRAMDAFYEEDERIVGHAADAYHRIDIRRTSRHLVVKDGEKTIADTKRPMVLYESGFAPRWYVPREDIAEDALVPTEGQTFCPYKGLASYYDVGHQRKAAWYYPEAWPEVAAISNLISFEADQLDIYLDGKKLQLEPGQTVVAHGIDRGLEPDEILTRR